MKALRRNGSPARIGGHAARASCADRCCGGTPAFFYVAFRCDILFPTPFPLPIPETVPTVIAIPGPWGCPGEPCQVSGGRLVLFGGYCYVVEAVIPEEPQDDPCGEHLKPRKYLPEQVPAEAVTVDHSQLTCKPLGETCDVDCIPQAPPGSCCAPTNCTEPPEGTNTECFPCDCPRFNRYALVVSWTATVRTRAPFTCDPEILMVSSGNVSLTFNCATTGIFESKTGQIVRTCVDDCGACDGVEYNGAPGPSWAVGLGFGDVPVDLVMSEIPFPNCSGSLSCNPFRLPSQSDGTIPCAGTITFDAGCVGTCSWNQTANCFGGTLSLTSTGAGADNPGCVRGEISIAASWTWVPLVRCPEDPNPILDVPPAVKADVRKALRRIQTPSRLSFRDLLGMILGGA